MQFSTRNAKLEKGHIVSNPLVVSTSSVMDIKQFLYNLKCLVVANFCPTAYLMRASHILSSSSITRSIPVPFEVTIGVINGLLGIDPNRTHDCVLVRKIFRASIQVLGCRHIISLSTLVMLQSEKKRKREVEASTVLFQSSDSGQPK